MTPDCGTCGHAWVDHRLVWIPYMTTFGPCAHPCKLGSWDFDPKKKEPRCKCERYTPPEEKKENMDIFDCEKFRERLVDCQPTRAAVIVRAFEQYVKGNDSFKDKSSAQMDDYFETFRSAWILSEMFSAPRKM